MEWVDGILKELVHNVWAQFPAVLVMVVLFVLLIFASLKVRQLNMKLSQLCQKLSQTQSQQCEYFQTKEPKCKLKNSQHQHKAILDENNH